MFGWKWIDVLWAVFLTSTVCLMLFLAWDSCLCRKKKFDLKPVPDPKFSSSSNLGEPMQVMPRKAQ